MRTETKEAAGRGRAMGAEGAGEGERARASDAFRLVLGAWVISIVRSLRASWSVCLTGSTPGGGVHATLRVYPERAGAVAFALSLGAWLDAFDRWPESAELDGIEDQAGPIVRAPSLEPPVLPMGDQAALDALALALRSSSWERARDLADLLCARCDNEGVLKARASIAGLLDAIGDLAFDSSGGPVDGAVLGGVSFASNNLVSVVMLAGRIARHLDGLAALALDDEDDRQRAALSLAQWFVGQRDAQTVAEGLRMLRDGGQIHGYPWESFIVSAGRLAGVAVEVSR